MQGSGRPESFQEWYKMHDTGRGIWKWNNALAAYQRHFAVYKDAPVKLGEVGIQSGGSVEMWESVLGEQCHVYGIDINPNTKKFAVEGKVTISLGDQGDPEMWETFFKETTQNLDILVDDGGHEPAQMIATFEGVWPHLSPGGFLSIEDIHGQEKYMADFFTPIATYLGTQAKDGNLDSVHVYPFVLIGQRTGPESHNLQFAGEAVEVSEFQQIWDKIHSSQHWGNHIVLKNDGWGPFLTSAGINNFFLHFQDLHGANWFDEPTGCERTSAAVCKNTVRPTKMQAEVTGIHIYKDRLVVEVPASPVKIEAVRRGNEWIGYGF